VARAMAGANENAAEDMGNFVGALDRLRTAWGATVLVLHHTGVDPSAQDRGRGSSALRAAMDSEFVIRPGDPDFSLRATKCKDWPEPRPLHLHRVVVRLPDIASHEAEETSLALSDRVLPRDDDALRDKARDLKAKGQTIRSIADELGRPKSTIQRWVGE
jgi:hypothetical protein